MKYQSLTRILFSMFIVGTMSCTGTAENESGAMESSTKRSSPPEELPIGSKAPEFSLIGVDDSMHTFAGCAGAKGTILIYTCNHCPWAIAYEDRLITIAKEYKKKGVGSVAISCNDVRAYPSDGLDSMKVRAKEKGLPYPYLYDESQEVALKYGPKVTPHIYLFDEDKTLVYRGRVDDSAKPEEIENHDLINALDQMLAGKAVAVKTTKAFGCSIKWKDEVATWPKEKKS